MEQEKILDCIKRLCKGCPLENKCDSWCKYAIILFNANSKK